MAVVFLKKLSSLFFLKINKQTNTRSRDDDDDDDEEDEEGEEEKLLKHLFFLFVWRHF